jgi:hypothetical protein
VLVAHSLAVALAFSPAPAASQPAPFDFYDRGPYRAGVPRPAEVLGYEAGTFHTSFGNMERYVDALLRAAPERLRRVPFGRTYEFRERALLVVTSPANHARIAAIREATAKLADPRRVARPANAEALIRDTPVTVWLNYSIHGDESASFEAMAQVAYQLAAGEDAETRKILENCVVILDLAHNPDGHERFVTWVNALGSGNPDPWALEQQRQQPWGIGGRTNHYQFDLNRDALAMSQLESRQIARAIRDWHPQVFVDHHGQTASYFFPPTAPPLHHVFPEADLERWTERFGRENARAFDRYGWNYYVRDVFDFFYPGYWDSWPTLLGAIGMTYETDGGGNLALRRDDETVVTLRDGIERHFVASLATCSTAAANRAERLRDFHRFARSAIDQAGAGGVRAYAIDPGDDPVRAAALAENLLEAGVEVGWHAAPFHAASARPVWSDPPATKPAGKGKRAPAPAAAGAHAFEHGAFVVDLAQPAARVARALLERDAPIDSGFARSQLDKYQRNLARGKNAPSEPYDFYDVTAWSLPVAYGVATFELSAPPAGAAPLAAPDPAAEDPAEERLPDTLAVGVPQPARVSRAAPLALRDAKGKTALDLAGRIEGGRARTAYVWSCAQDGAPRLALRLLQEDFKVATATRPLRAGDKDFPRGSFIARVERNPATLHARIEALARSCGVTVAAVNTAYTDRGDTGVGSESVVSLKRLRLAVLVDGPISPTSYGWLWFLLERRLGLRFTAVRAQDLGGADLDRYNAVVIPDGNAGALASAIGEGGIAKLKGWVARGGALVCLDDAAEFPTLKSVGLSSAWPVGVRRKEAKEDEDEKEAVPDSVREAERRPQYVPGAIFWASLDPRHFLCYGFERPRIPVMLQGRLFLRPSKEGANPMTFDREPLALSGWTWPETARRLQGTAFAVDEPSGDGHVILIEGPVTFRLFWRNTERLLLNAITYAPALD